MRVALEPGVRVFLSRLGTAARAEYGLEHPTLSRLGVPTAKKPKLTSEQHVARAAKAWETRLRNRTLGKRQKQRLARGEPLDKVIGSRRKKR